MPQSIFFILAGYIYNHIQTGVDACSDPTYNQARSCNLIDRSIQLVPNKVRMARGGVVWLAVALLCCCFVRHCESARVFTIINQCKTMVWPAVTPGESFGGGGFALKPGQSMVFTAPVGWSGRIWGRTECDFDQAGNGSCATGSCGSELKCGGSGATPATLAEFTLATKDFYDVSLVDGFNLPMVVRPLNGEGNCSVAGCDGDLRDSCPSELSKKVNGRTVACRSACDVFDTDQYCCRGMYGNPSTCQPTFYSKKFKAACPTAYSYAYDDPTSIFTCSNADYTITFCSTRKRPVCTYHNNRLICSASTRSWPSVISALLFTFLALQFSL
ncbi:hypothetical protein DAI22_04g319600 [Oryza sativa Japonica Group]|nr:hypothetical protein DAI22_04g319600 [Oryza sativa Japonica Group]